MFHSASSKQNAWSPSMLPRVNSFNAFDSFAPWILCLPMGGSWRVQAANMRSFVDCAITCMRSAIHSTSPSALSRTPTSHRARRRHRILARHSTCVGDVPPSIAKWPFSHLPRPALQPSHQDPHRSTQTRHTMKTGRDWPVKSHFGKPACLQGYPVRLI